MKLDEKALSEFEKILKKTHPDEKFKKEEVLDMATRTLRLIEILFTQIPRDKLKEVNKLKFKNNE